MSAWFAPPYQQFPSSPCRISDGLGVRNTDHFTDRSLKMLQLISWGRSHCFTLCCTLSPSGNPTDLGPGWKLSSTKLTLFCESERQGEHQCAAHSSPGPPGTGLAWKASRCTPRSESGAPSPSAWPGQPLPTPCRGAGLGPGVCWQRHRCVLCIRSSHEPAHLSGPQAPD